MRAGGAMMAKGAKLTITGADVREARKLLGWDQAELAAKSGVAASVIATFENGNDRIGMANVYAIQRTVESAGLKLANGGAAIRAYEAVYENDARRRVPWRAVIVILLVSIAVISATTYGQHVWSLVWVVGWLLTLPFR